jgi:hypothetical protein
MKFANTTDSYKLDVAKLPEAAVSVHRLMPVHILYDPGERRR